MDNKRLGKKIKEIRIAKKMTQSEVVGTFITRNMLSQIESGAANPSIKTLEYLAWSLDVPLNQLVSDKIDADEGETADNELKTFIKAKEAFKEGNPDAATALLTDKGKSFRYLADEAAALLARCYLALGEKSAENQELENASVLLGKSAELFGIGIYKSEELKENAHSLLEKTQAKS